MKLLLITGIMMLIMTLLKGYKAFKQHLLMRKSEKIKAHIIRNDFEMAANNIVFYSPVYSYEHEGELKEFKSPAKQLRPLTIGAPMYLYYNKEKEQVVDLSDYAANITLSIVGAICIAIVLFIKLGGN